MTERDINDPAFFEDANIDEIAEPMESVPDPDAGVDDAVVDDDSESVAGDAEGEGEAGDSAGDEGDEAVADESSDDAVSDPAPHLEDLDTAKVAYGELRKWANQRDMEARKAAERIAELEAAAEESFDYGDLEDDTPEYDPQAFSYMTQQDPRAAFRYALDGGNDVDASAAIAKVQSDAQEVAAMAAAAQANNDADAYASLSGQSMNLNALAESMRGELARAQYEKANAPLVQAEQKRNVEYAWNTVNQRTNGDLAARHAQVRQVLAERPYLVGGATPEAIMRGYEDAYTIAKSLPDPAAPTAEAPDIDAVVQKAVADHIAATRKAKKQAAEAASGADAGRAAPGGSSQEPSLKDSIYQDQANASIGARRFMAL